VCACSNTSLPSGGAVKPWTQLDLIPHSDDTTETLSPRKEEPIMKEPIEPIMGLHGTSLSAALGILRDGVRCEGERGIYGDGWYLAEGGTIQADGTPASQDQAKAAFATAVKYANQCEDYEKQRHSIDAIRAILLVKISAPEPILEDHPNKFMRYHKESVNGQSGPALCRVFHNNYHDPVPSFIRAGYRAMQGDTVNIVGLFVPTEDADAALGPRVSAPPIPSHQFSSSAEKGAAAAKHL
jgi:hypothetical protein